MVNRNMHIESCHRLLKVVYLEGKQNRRLDHLIHIILKVARDKGFERLQKLHKGKLSYRGCELNRRHKNAVEMASSGISTICLPDNTREVQSQSNPLVRYTVRPQPLHKCDCKVKCSACNICVYAYTCTCIDYALHSTACKHIHFVHMAIPSQRTAIEPTSDSTPVAGGILEHIVQTAPTSRAANLQQCVLSKAQEVIALAKVTDKTDALAAAAKHLGNAIREYSSTLYVGMTRVKNGSQIKRVH